MSDKKSVALAQHVLLSEPKGVRWEEEERCVVAFIPQKDMQMKYHITYRLMHPHYMPTMFVAIVQASSHAELDAKIAKIKTKWQARGYTVQMMHVRQQKKPQRNQHP